MKYFIPYLLLFFSFNVSEQQQKNIGLKTMELKEETHARRIPAYGSVVDPGALLTMRSDWLSARGMWEKSKEALWYSEKNFLRQKKLFEEGQNVSEKTFQQAKMVYVTDRVSERANHRLLSNLKESVRLNWGPKILKWILQNTSEIQKLAEEKIALVQISLPPAEALEQIPKEAALELFPHIVKKASFVSFAPKMNSYIQNLSFFYLAKNQDSLLLPGRNVKAYLLTGPEQKGVVVPFSAVVNWQGKSWVFVQKEENEFQKKEIATDFAVKGGWFVRKGLKNQDRLVVVGAQELLAEELFSSGGVSKASLGEQEDHD